MRTVQLTPAPRPRAILLLATLGLGTTASAARAQDATGRELAELRALVRQQAQAMQQQQRTLQALQGRLANLEASQRQRPAPERPRTAAGPPGLPQGGSQTADNTAPGAGTSVEAGPQTQRPGQAPQQPLRAGASPLPGTSPGSTTQRQPSEGGNQPPGPGTTEASPSLQAEREPSPAALLGLPALPVLSGNDRIKVTLSGQVNRAVLVHGDGSGKVDSYFVDNDTSSTRLRVLGAASLDENTTAVSAIEFDLRSNSSNSVSRQSVNNNGGDTPTLGPFRIRRAELGMLSAYGTLLLGRGSTYADGIAQFDLSGTSVAINSSMSNSGGSLQFANRAQPYRRVGDPLVSQVFDDFDGPRDDRLRYDTPAWRGLTFGGSVGQGLYYDLGTRWSGEVNGVKIAAGVAFMNFTGTLPSKVAAGTESQDGDNSPTSPFARRVAGSVAFLAPNGINGLVSAGWGQHYGGCCGAGLVARNDSATYYLKAGYQASIFSFGKTNFSVDGGQTRNRIQDGDTASRFGVQINQPIVSEAFEVYAGWEHIMLRRTEAQLRHGDIGLIGSRLQF